MDSDTIRRRIRSLVKTGDLPCEDECPTYAGHGENKRCSACLDPITPGQTEFEVDLPASGKTLRLHSVCHAIYVEECELLKP